MVKSSRPDVFCEKGVLRNLAKFTGKHLCQSLFFNKVAGAVFNRTPLVAASVGLLLLIKESHKKHHHYYFPFEYRF